jgi:hypothetical protein
VITIELVQAYKAQVVAYLKSLNTDHDRFIRPIDKICMTYVPRSMQVTQRMLPGRKRRRIER